MTLIEEKLYRKIVATFIVDGNKDVYQDEGTEYDRYIIDLEDDFLFYFPDFDGKITHSRLGVIFSNNETFTGLFPELKEIYNQILRG